MSDSTSTSKRLLLPCHARSLSQLRWVLGSLAYEFGFRLENQDEVVMAADEAFSNILEHAYPDPADAPPLEICITLMQDSFVVDLIDEGIPFDFQSYTMPEFPQHFLEGNERGAGVYMIHKCMDQVEYSRLPGERNRTRLVKLRRSVHQPEAIECTA